MLADNNRVIATSQVYTTKAAALKGIDSIAENAPFAPIEDQTVADYEKKEVPKFEVYKDKAGDFRFRLKAGKAEIIADSEGYKTKYGCLNGIESVQNNADWSEVQEG